MIRGLVIRVLAIRVLALTLVLGLKAVRLLINFEKELVRQIYLPN